MNAKPLTEREAIYNCKVNLDFGDDPCFEGS